MGTRNIHPDQLYIEGLLKNDHNVVDAIYGRFAPKVIAYIQKNSGDEQAARDIIQETLMTIYDQAKTKGLELTCPFDAYFFLICKRKWLNALKKKGHREVTIEAERLSISDESDRHATETQNFEARQALYLAVLAKMGDVCKQLITLGFSALSMQEVAEQLGISYAYARKKKSTCLSKLTRLIKESPQYRLLKKEY